MFFLVKNNGLLSLDFKINAVTESYETICFKKSCIGNLNSEVND